MNANTDLKNRLIKIKELYDVSIINEEEYLLKREGIIEKL